MKRVILAGSPRANGRSGHLAELLFEANIDERPEDELFLVPVSEVEIGPCIGCGACREKSSVLYKDDDGNEVSELRHRCVFDDDMQTLYDLLDDADELTVVAPVYFSGAPAPLKCVLDRMQPYFWADTRKAPKRPATLHVVGEGGDPHGFSPLVSEVKSSLACAGFRLERVFDWVGRIDESGEILEEAVEHEIRPNKSSASEAAPDSSRDNASAQGPADHEQCRGNEPTVERSSRSAQRRSGNANARPKLDLSSGGKGGKQKRPAARNDKDAPAKADAGSRRQKGSKDPKGPSAKSPSGKRAAGNRGGKGTGRGRR